MGGGFGGLHYHADGSHYYSGHIAEMNALMAIFLLSVGFAAGLAVARIYQVVNTFADQGPKRNTHKNAMTIENWLALAWRAKLDQNEAFAMLDTLIELLQAYRADPSNYDPDKPIKK